MINNTTPPLSNGSPNSDQIRREVAEILYRHRRGLPGYRGDSSPPPVAIQLERVETTLNEGRSFLAKGSLAEALLRADTAIGLAPAGHQWLADSWSFRGDVCLQQGHVQTARSAYQQAMAINPAHVAARLGMAETFRRAHQDQRAIPLYLETIPLITDLEERTRVRLLLSDTYLAIGKPEAARRVLRTAETTKGLSANEKMRAAFTMLRPDSVLMWGLILLVASLSTFFAIDSQLMAGVLILIIGLSLYSALQWWRTPVH